MSARPISTSASRWRRIATRRNAGRTMIVVACVGLVASVTGLVVGWRLLGQVQTNANQSLVLTGDALVTLDQTLDVADEVMTSIGHGLGTVETTLDAVNSSFGAGAQVLADVASTTDQLPPSFARLDQALANAETAAGVIDDALHQLNRLPAVNIDLGNGIAPSIQQVRAELGPLAQNLSASTKDLRTLTTSSADVGHQLQQLRTDVAGLDAELARSHGLIAAYRQTARDAMTLAQRSRSDLGGDITLSRVLLVILAVAVAVGQIVPFWVGRELLLEERAAAALSQLGRENRTDRPRHLLGPRRASEA
jgi:hypothetical protein